jgi:leucyl-tRNA synthetase
MSKSLGNTVSPDSLLVKYGSDALKMYELYIGPFSQMAKWDQNGIVGMHRFLQKVEKMLKLKFVQNNDINIIIINRAIKKVTEDIENFNFNTAISTLIETFNSISLNSWSKSDIQAFLTLLCPFAPKTAKKVSDKLEVDVNIWPQFSEKYLLSENITIPIQINGKVRDQLIVKNNISENEISHLIDSNKKIKQWIPDSGIKKIIFVKGKIVSVVV